MAKGKVVELPVPQFPCCWKGECGIYPKQRKWDEFIKYTCNTVGGSCLWRKGNMGSAISAERMFYPQFVLKNTACKEVLLITPKNQQHALHSKSLSHMLVLFSWLLPSVGHNLLSLTTALKLLPNAGSPFPTQNSCTELKGSTPREMESPDGSWGHSDICENRSQLEESDPKLLFYANSLADERQLSLETPWWESQQPTGSKIQTILVSYLKKRELQELNIAWRCLFSPHKGWGWWTFIF